MKVRHPQLFWQKITVESFENPYVCILTKTKDLFLSSTKIAMTQSWNTLRETDVLWNFNSASRKIKYKDITSMKMIILHHLTFSLNSDSTVWHFWDNKILYPAQDLSLTHELSTSLLLTRSTSCSRNNFCWFYLFEK